MKAGKETELYNQGYMDGYDDAEKAHVDPIVPKLKGSDPDYWTRLEHQAAIAAMQGILSNANHALWDRENNAEGIAKSASAIAHALVEKYKKEERK